MDDLTNYRYPIALGAGTGVELEYMIVDSDTLDVKPIADEVIRCVAGEYVSDAEPEGEGGVVGWSNELALHVIELKTIGPVAALDGLARRFQGHVAHINGILRPMNARLLPTAMHPWMDPHREMKLWPHEFSPIYEAFDRIFSCKGHGWANLQSTHINLAFGDDKEFGRLHAALRLILPLLPGLAASSPMMDGRLTGLADTRLDVYRQNSRRVPSVCGLVVPEPVYTRATYEHELLERIYRDMAPLDPEGILQHEWLNARGLIARFSRGSIEIRVLDIQESPAADLAIVAIVTELARALISERWTSVAEQQQWATEPLSEFFLRCVRDGERAIIDDPAYLRAFGVSGERALAVGEVWAHLVEQFRSELTEHLPALDTIVREGTLSTRLRRALGRSPDRDAARRVYRRLADCLASGELFLPAMEFAD